MNDLTVSNIERQNVLNNRYAVEVLQENLGFTGMFFEGEYRFTKKMVADFYEVDERTIERLLEEHSEELKHNGYVLSKGKQLKEFKLQFAPVINVGSKTTQLGLFSFRTVLNVGMLLTESEVAKKVRARILDIVISTINKRAGGGTKYINTRDIDFVTAAIEEDNYRKNFTAAVGRCVQGHKNYKYAQITKLMLPDQMDIITRAAPRMRRRSLSVERLYLETLRASDGLRKGQENANVALQCVIVFARAVGGD